MVNTNPVGVSTRRFLNLMVISSDEAQHGCVCEAYNVPGNPRDLGNSTS